MNYRSVCTGIAAETVAWHPLGWKALSFAEIDPFCSSLLKQRYSDVYNYGDFTMMGNYEEFHEGPEPATGLIFGGTPCQSFSHAGNRKGLDDARGDLALQFIKLAQRLRVRWVVWENVAGVLSRGQGRAFGTFLGSLVLSGYGVAYRILDAQFDGLAQRRKRVFVVGYLGDWRPSVAVLFERQSLLRNTAPGRTKPADPSCVYVNQDARTKVDHHVARVLKSDRGSGGRGCVATEDGVRLLTPIEWERLMGFPDDYTLIDYRGKPAADGPRYKAIGNSVAVPTLRWIGRRIQMVEDILAQQ